MFEDHLAFDPTNVPFIFGDDVADPLGRTGGPYADVEYAYKQERAAAEVEQRFPDLTVNNLRSRMALAAVPTRDEFFSKILALKDAGVANVKSLADDPFSL